MKNKSSLIMSTPPSWKQTANTKLWKKLTTRSKEAALRVFQFDPRARGAWS